jgi:hypothetical protein
MVFDKASYPTLENLNFSFQIRIADLSQDVIVEVHTAAKPAGWDIGDDIPLLSPTVINNDNVGDGNSLILSAEMFNNDNTVTVSNKLSEYDMSLYKSVQVGLRIQINDQNTIGLNDICSRIYTTLVIDPN